MSFLIATALLVGILNAEASRSRTLASVLRDMAEIRERGPISESVADFLSRPLDSLGAKCFKLAGCVDDVVHDDRDVDYHFFVVRSPDGVFYVTAEDPSPPYDYRSLIGATASFCPPATSASCCRRRGSASKVILKRFICLIVGQTLC